MDAEVTSTNSGNSEVLTTQDLLGTLTKSCKSKPETELQVPDSFDKHLNFKSEKVYSKRCQTPSSPISSSSSSSSSSNNKQKQKSLLMETLQELNYHPSPSSKFFQETCNLDLKLEFSSRYQSVCTLDKVKSALERAEKQAKKKQQQCSSSSCLNNKDDEDQEKEETNSSSSDMFAAGCPACLFYVITLRANPMCPRCNSIVPSPLPLKKPLIDLNAAV